MSLRHAFGFACLLALVASGSVLFVFIVWYLLATALPLGIGLLVVCVLMIGALWGLDP